ncbi:MAG: glycosyltransferase family 4 protein [Anaerolineales bacterium]
MKLGINGWRIHGRRTGVGRYILNVVRHWTAEMCAGRFDQVTFYSPQPTNREEIPLPQNIEERVLASGLPMLVWENLRLGPAADDDVLFQPAYSIPLWRRGKTVVVSHDAAHELYPRLFPKSVRYFYAPLYRWSARHATFVISDSEAGKQDVARKMGIPLSKIRVVHLAPDNFFRRRPDDAILSQVRRQHLGSDVPFLLFVGKLSGRRSIPLLLEGFAGFKRATHLPHKLVVIGLNIHNIDVARLIKDLGIEDEVMYPGYISDEALNAFYHAATGLISPSIYETVCLPVMEAQAAGAAVICPDTAGMQEITGGHALLLPKPEVPEMTNAITKLAQDSALRRALIAKSLVHSQRFSWERCSAETLDVLEEVARC